jgi:hypothetical protein
MIENEIECPRCGESVCHELTRCPECGLIFYPLDEDEEQDMSWPPGGGSGIAGLLDAIRRLFGIK